MTQLPTTEQLENCKKSNWKFGDSVSYDLCRDNFDHQEIDKILAKVWLIGRAYSVAIERRKNKKETTDDFYIKKVAPTIQGSQLDTKLGAIRKYNRITSENAFEILKVHGYLTKELYTITGLNKRSFCSKYLHFHLPELFLIYDSRAVMALRKFIAQVPKELYYVTKSTEVDNEYAEFTSKCLDLKNQLTKHGVNLTNRQLDNLLLYLLIAK